MIVFLYLKSGTQFEFVPQIRLTRSKNGTTGTAVFEVNLSQINELQNICDPIYNVGIQKGNRLRMADRCHFIWASGKPIKLIAIFLFAALEEKQEFFNYYPHYAINNSLEFFPAQRQEKTQDFKQDKLTS
uniref:Photosystem II protein psb28 n=1 Tax=Eustigmatophyceae sp. Ndem 8/9T-3m6.8 TaxID=2506146 RepID=A0A3R5QNS3_9STRA|nr:photosystem II protein psb28 [Eustigmatophyceae sp. Ndem 8/9T-3m6.8]QAA11873.1 photosystem II protein psb28 [Eustigmatophyceae sp. Ndem 8/9T-3m6.8]